MNLTNESIDSSGVEQGAEDPVLEGDSDDGSGEQGQLSDWWTFALAKLQLEWRGVDFPSDHPLAPFLWQAKELARVGKLTRIRVNALQDLGIQLPEQQESMSRSAQTDLIRERIARGISPGLAISLGEVGVLPAPMMQLQRPVSQGMRLRLWSPAAAMTDPGSFASRSEPDDLLWQGWVIGINGGATLRAQDASGQQQLLSPQGRASLWWAPAHDHLVAVWSDKRGCLLSLDIDVTLAGQMEFVRRFDSGALRGIPACLQWARTAHFLRSTSERWTRFECKVNELKTFARSQASIGPPSIPLDLWPDRERQVLNNLRSLMRSRQFSASQILRLAMLDFDVPEFGGPAFTSPLYERGMPVIPTAPAPA